MEEKKQYLFLGGEMERDDGGNEKMCKTLEELEAGEHPRRCSKIRRIGVRTGEEEQESTGPRMENRLDKLQPGRGASRSKKSAFQILGV
jgi:hypothetical protein